MKHITEEYGQPCNLLELSEEEYRELDAFLRLEGIIIRRCRSYCGTTTIQAENPYKSMLAHSAGTGHSVKKAYRAAEEEMSDQQVARYKR